MHYLDEDTGWGPIVAVGIVLSVVVVVAMAIFIYVRFFGP